ncbi:hypothetical protein [Acetobacter persici]|uniref:hypothetical protein n=1 Tax=Acetobacter persici TaxID=1076596 RepID=UPI001BAD8638|nr:hypothetical protein [Acetobacter persici]MBS0964460.1 hypothetical protein [Acetobacter persici]
MTAQKDEMVGLMIQALPLQEFSGARERQPHFRVPEMHPILRGVSEKRREK